ncbi:MAG: hypothetical protein ACK4OP_01195 [Gemmobacter sp.]
MTGGRKPSARPVAVLLRLRCAYAGDGWVAGPGEFVEVDRAEAARLVAIGAAVEAGAP